MSSKVWFWILFSVLVLASAAILILSPAGGLILVFFKGAVILILGALLRASQVIAVVFLPIIIGIILAMVLNDVIDGLNPQLNGSWKFLTFLLAAFVFGYLARLYFYALGVLLLPALIVALPLEIAGSWIWFVATVIFFIGAATSAEWLEF